MNFVYALYIPLAVLIAVNFIFRAPAHKHHVTILGFAIGVILTMFLTDLVKNMVGRPRRCFLWIYARRECLLDQI